MVSRLSAKSTGPTEIFRRRVVGTSCCLEAGLLGGLLAVLCGDFDLSTCFKRELAVVALETGCRGRELRKGGDSFGGGAEM